MMVAVIGMSAIALTRVQTRIANANRDVTKARFYSQSLIDVVLLRLAGNANWRNTYTDDTWSTAETVGDVTLQFKLVDEDGDLADDAADPVRLYAKATVGQAVRIVSVLLDKGEAVEAATTTFEKRINNSNDDVEQHTGNGWMYEISTDLELAFDPEGDPSIHTHMVGMRFTNVSIPSGAEIVNAYVQFTVDEVTTGAAALNVFGEDSDNAPSFTTSPYNLSNRLRTTSVTWSPLDWNTVGEAGPDQRTSDIAEVIQQVVDRSGWSSANALVIMVDGSGTRTAESHNGSSADAPLLHVEWKDRIMTPVAGTWRREVEP